MTRGRGAGDAAAGRGGTWARARRRLEESEAPPEALAVFDDVLSRRALGKALAGGAGLAAAAAFGAGADAALRGLFGRGLLPAAWAGPPGDKPGITMHGDRPVTGEFAPHLLGDAVTPSARHFVRNNGTLGARAETGDLRGWTLTIDGAVREPLSLSMADLEAMPAVTMPLMIECGGNGRAFFDPPVRGNPWGRGAVGCSAWTGVRLRDILRRAGVAPGAIYTAHYGDDHPLGRAEPFSRGIPIEKALDEHTLVAYAMNGRPLPPLNGFPARLVVPGWVGSCSQKWLTRITLRTTVHDSQRMRGYSYRVPRHPVPPGSRPPESEMEIATSWGVKSMVTAPAEGAALPAGSPVTVAGHAWAGEGEVEEVLVSIDYGVRWVRARLEKPPNRFAWAGFSAPVTFPGPGYYEVWARAIDADGGAQPFRQPWNPRGYLGNVIHRVPVRVT